MTIVLIDQQEKDIRALGERLLEISRGSPLDPNHFASLLKNVEIKTTKVIEDLQEDDEVDVCEADSDSESKPQSEEEPVRLSCRLFTDENNEVEGVMLLDHRRPEDCHMLEGLDQLERERTPGVKKPKNNDQEVPQLEEMK